MTHIKTVKISSIWQWQKGVIVQRVRFPQQMGPVEDNPIIA